MKYIIVLIFFIFFTTSNSVSQQSLDYEQYTTDKGLSENVVYCISQDKKGFIWAGTHHGLNRYDGYGFKKYFSFNDDSSSLSQNEIYCIKQDEDGMIWIGASLGLNYFNPETGKNKRIMGDGISTGYSVSDLYIINKDSVLVLCGPKLYLYLTQKELWKLVTPPAEKFIATRICIYKNKIIGVSSSNSSGFTVYNKNQNRLEEVQKIPGTEIPFTSIAGFYSYSPAGYHIISKLNEAFEVYSEAGIKIAVLDKNNYPFISSAVVFDIASLPSGETWISTMKGLFSWKPGMTSIQQVELVGDSRSLKGNKEIRSLLIDRDENLWLGIFGEGLLKCRIRQSAFASISLGYMSPGNLQRMIFGLYKWPGNHIAAETSFKNFSIVINKKVTGFENTDNMSLEKIVEVSTGKLLSELTPSQLKIVRSLYAIKRLVPHQFIFHDENTVLKTAPDYNVYRSDTSYILASVYSTSSIDDGEYYWAATTEALLQINKKTLSLKYYKYEKDNPYSLNENYLYHLRADKENNLWIGTKGGGLNFFNRKENRFYHYTTDDGLPDNVIYFILPDKKGNLWLTTNNGLSRFNPVTKTFTNFSRRDGLLNAEFNRNGGVMADDGTLYFSGTNGIDYFNPDELEANISKPAVFISAIEINGKELSLTEVSRLKYFQNNITLSFTANDFSRPDLVYYRYRMRNSEEWIRVQGKNAVAYNILQHGSYRFEVQSSYDNYNWSESAVCAFEIETPWWKSVWFYLFTGLFLSALLFSLYRNRIRQLKKVLDMRTKISQDLHDEVGATLSSIHVYSSVASMSLEKDITKAKDALQHINTNTRQVMENMSDIVWAINTGQIGEPTLEAKLKNYGYELLTPMNIQCTYRIDKDADRKIENMEARKNILLIAKEAMNNIAKYSAASTALVKLELENRKLHLEISDNGVGFDYEKRRNGNGLNNMRQRSEILKGTFSCDTGKTKGTTIRCNIPVTTISD